MKQIPLTRGQVALVDDSDYDYLMQWKWQANFRKDRNGFYAFRIKWDNGRYIGIYMHRVIMGIIDKNIHIDHKDHNLLNNCRSNLRIASPSQNGGNRTSNKNSSSRYLGVSWKKSHKAWEVMIQKDKKQYYIGQFKNEENAALAYNQAAIKLHGEFANLNQV